MLQRKGEPRVSQAAWVRSLISSFFNTGRGKGGRRGLFQCAYDDTGMTLAWERVQQIAFIIEFWRNLRESIEEDSPDWSKMYESAEKDAFTDKSSLLNQDIGVRAVHAVVNDIFFGRVQEWKLDEWYFGIEDKTATTEEDIEEAIEELRSTEFCDYLARTAKAIAGFDWRSLDGPNIRGSDLEMTKRAYRGSGGYTVLTNKVIEYVSHHEDEDIAGAALDLLPTA